MIQEQHTKYYILQIGLLFGVLTLCAWIMVRLQTQAQQADQFFIAVSHFLQQPFTFLIVFGSLFIIAALVVQHLKSHQFWKLFFRLGTFIGVYTVFFTLFHALTGSLSYVFALFFTLLFVRVGSHMHSVWWHNILLVCAIVGLGFLYGSQFGPHQSALIVAVVSVYDAITLLSTSKMLNTIRPLFRNTTRTGFIVLGSFFQLPQSVGAVSQQPIFVIRAIDLIFPLGLAISHFVFVGVGAFFFFMITFYIGLFVSALLSWRYPQRFLPTLSITGGICFAAYYILWFVLPIPL